VRAVGFQKLILSRSGQFAFMCELNWVFSPQTVVSIARGFTLALRTVSFPHHTIDVSKS